MADWQSGKTALECHAHMFDQSVRSDVTFVISNSIGLKSKQPDPLSEGESQTRIKSHKYMLIARSPVFMNMFYGSVAETKDEVNIEDVDPEAFGKVIRFLYTDTIELDANNVMSVWYIAKKYMLNTLISKCSYFLKTYLCPDNAATLLDQALFFEDHDLVTMCLRQIRRNPTQVFSSLSFYEISQSTLDRILDSDNMDIDELDIFGGCRKWAETECRKRNIETSGPSMRSVLAESIYKIRFPLISPEIFTKEVSDTNILSESDELKLFRYMCSGDEKAKNGLPFSSDQRCRLGQQIKLYSEMKDIAIIETDGALFHTLELEVSDAINVEGLVIYDAVRLANCDRQHVPNLTVSAQINGRFIGQNIDYMETINDELGLKRFSWDYGRLLKGTHTMTVHFWVSLCSHCGRQNPYTKHNFSYCFTKGCRNNLVYQGPVGGFESGEVYLDDGLVSVKITNKKSKFMPVVGLLYSL